ncbi:DUF928 domain-containing protein [Lusitaniella coriacea LEGE 07157]|uniref:DUF928 domain-containing protein n=1 Tax=Lusitaniella coriacea LEGE 07157 TaxID=945747 RepID=A0A8J7DSV5_9CYAN|nr:DUF928 domain-containing protein [Lusitaniella coriacea]MBE9114832.1 DUF928 domain-containing protein [Lusitaniella coriacea LEGE 07157]
MNPKTQLLTRLFSTTVFVASVSAYSLGASAVNFTPPPNNQAPRQATGGASRTVFTPPSDNASPRQTAGGAARTDFTPPSDNVSPSQTAGGAARTDFTPPSDNASPSQTAGGAARTDFTPPSDNASPSQTAGGAARTDFAPPHDNVSPRQTAGAGSRTPSVTAQVLGVQALTPPSYYGTTLQERPKILVYLPASSAREVVFSIKDEDKNSIYEMTIPITGNAGIVSAQLPPDAPALEVGKHYQWYFALKIDGELTPRSPFVDGWVERIAPSSTLAQSLQGASPLETAEILGENGVWYDCVVALAALRTTQPTNESILDHWQELLGSVELENFASAPFVVSLQ